MRILARNVADSPQQWSMLRCTELNTDHQFFRYWIFSWCSSFMSWVLWALFLLVSQRHHCIFFSNFGWYTSYWSKKLLWHHSYHTDSSSTSKRNKRPATPERFHCVPYFTLTPIATSKARNERVTFNLFSQTVSSRKQYMVKDARHEK
jgi:hypothetical protein